MSKEKDVLEILSVDLLETAKKEVLLADYITDIFDIAIGWHYILDIAWIIKNIDLPPGSTILDAGAARGLLQFVLAYKGYNVISVDFMERTPPVHIAKIIPFKVMSDDKISDHKYLNRLQSVYGKGKGNSGKRVMTSQNITHKLKVFLDFGKRHILKDRNYFKEFLLAMTGLRKTGIITYYRADFRHMKRIPSSSIDCVVSVSAIEHNEHQETREAVREFIRILKPGAKMIITTSAYKDRDWYHQQSMGWCYCEKSLVDLFGIEKEYFSNFEKYDFYFEQLKKSEEMKSRLADFYKESGNNGMPWGIWDPTYQPVGVIKNKRSNE